MRSGLESSSALWIAVLSRRSYSRLRGTKTCLHPRALSLSTTQEPTNPAPPVTITRLCPQNESISRPNPSRRSQRGRLAAGHPGVPLVPARELGGQGAPALTRWLQPERFHVGVYHDPDEFLESYSGLPV